MVFTFRTWKWVTPGHFFYLSHRTLVLGSTEEADVGILSHFDLDGLGGDAGDLDVDTEGLPMVVQLLVQGSLKVQGLVRNEVVGGFC